MLYYLIGKGEKYLSFPESIYFKIRENIIKYFNEEAIYQNGNYIIKNKYNILTICNDLFIIFSIIKIVGKKYYGESKKIELIKNICQKYKIEYKQEEKSIEFLIITVL